MKNTIARLVPKSTDKNYSFQVMNCSTEQRDTIYKGFYDVSYSKPFMQGNYMRWIMVEFWINDYELIKKASEHLASLIGCELKIGDFTDDEIIIK